MSRLTSVFAALLLGFALAHAPLAQAQGADYDWGDNDWGDFDWGDFDDFVDNQEDPSDYDSDVDMDFEPDEIIALNLSRAGVKAARALGFRVQERQYLRTLNFTMARLRPPARMNSRTALARLRQADPKGFYDHNTIYSLAGQNSVAHCEGVRCYGQTMIGWGDTGCGVKTRVGIVDSALDTGNPALAGQKILYKRLHKSQPSAEEIEHGTAVAALLVGAPDSGFPGLMPEAELVAADVFSRDRNGNLLTDAARLATGLDWVASQKPSVINISITGPDGGVLRTSIRRLVRSGIAVVAAAGNLGPKAPAQYPAAYPEVTAVTAVDRQLQVYNKANRGDYVALAAPGVGIWTAGLKGVGVFREGTSFAAPFATAALALLKTREPKLQPASLLTLLKQQARDLGPPGNDPTFGWGLVQSGQCRS